MKAGLLVVVTALVLAVGGYYIYYHAAMAPTKGMLADSEGNLEWLRREYHLDDAQFDRIRELHREYAPVCDRMCARIAKSNKNLEALIEAHNTVTPEVEAAMNDCVAAQGECRRAMLRHVYAVSAEMSPANGKRYLEMMTVRIVQPGLRHEAIISR